MKAPNILGHTLLPELFRESPLIVDLGGNRGGFAEAMIRNFGASVWLYEPLPELFRSIPAVRGLSKFEEAVTAKEGDFTLRHSGDRCATVYEGHGEGQKFNVKGVTLGTVLARLPAGDIDLVKMDIEGAEIDILESAPDEVLQRVRQMTVEFHDFLYPDLAPRVLLIKKRVAKLGFYVVNFSYHTSGDVLFIRKDLISYPRILWLYAMKYVRGISRILSRP